MTEIDPKVFEKLVADAIDAIPERYMKRLENIAFIIEDEPSANQREKLSLRDHETLFGLYEGAPLPTRFGQTKILPDKITLFKTPLLQSSRNLDELKHRVNNTIWHEVAHYFGLDHGRISELEQGHNQI